MKTLNRIHLMFLTALLSAFLATTVLAATGEDDGSRSILADGAGNRALALGGAYAAIADDASAVIWNPGGLGWLQRREFQATHTNLIGLGFNEQYASLVLPSWRWGVGSLTFRRFGVDGIEQRNDRNLLLADDLTYSETELTAAYGRELGSAWALGGGLKLRRHSLGGFQDSGLGLDLGAIVKPGVAFGSNRRWAENLTIGLSVRNAVEPSLRLDQESVPDPSGVRTGVAYKHGLGRSGWILGTLDVEKTKEMDGHLHGGLEIRLVPALALRAGSNRGTLTAGLGVLWQDIGVDYIFENLTDNPIHRFGVSFRFGRSREQNRRIYQSAAEQELQMRLADEFIRRNEDRKIELLKQARAALKIGRTDEAADLVAMVQVIEPANEPARKLETEILLAQARQLEEVRDYPGAIVALSRLLELAPGETEAKSMLARIRAASDERTARTREIRSLLDQAMDDFASGELLAARSGFARVLALDPADTEARAMAERTERVIGGRINDLLEQAEALGRAAQFDEARAKLEEARELDATAPGLTVTRLRLDRMEADNHVPEPDPANLTAAATTDAPTDGSLVAPAPITPTEPEPISESQKRELAELYGRGLTAMASGSADQAVHFWELVWSIDPQYQQVSQNLKQYYLARGMEAFVAGELQTAVRHWENAVRVAPSDEKAQGYLKRAQDQLRRLEGISS